MMNEEKPRLRTGLFVKFRFIEQFPIGIVGAIINRPPNYLLANNWISEGNHILSPIGDGILFCKIPGRIISAPTDSNEHRIDKPEFAFKGLIFLYHSTILYKTNNGKELGICPLG